MFRICNAFAHAIFTNFAYFFRIKFVFFSQKAIQEQSIDLSEVDREILGTTGEKKPPENKNKEKEK